MIKRICCLDHGFIELVNHMNGDYEVYRNAKVSTGIPKDDIEDQIRLIDFLVKNRHTSPLEFIELEFHMKCPIYVARQHVRHRLQEMNEYSLRYRSIIPEFESVDDLEDIGKEEKTEYKRLCEEQLNFYNNVLTNLKNKYPNKEDFLKRARVREKIRGIMGTAFYTEFYFKMNLHAFANWIEKRMGPGAQPEIRVYAEAAWTLVKPIAPICCGAIEKYWLHIKEVPRRDDSIMSDPIKY